MKKILTTVAALLALSFGASADEGMWLLPLLQKMNIKSMQELGCRLTAEEIYNINNSSLKDAIVHFGGGCTGEMISNEGLLVTNHHCGYSNIQALSTPEHNYLENGFWAMNRNEELPARGLSVTFLEYMSDVTPVVEKARAAAQKKYKKTENSESLIESDVQEKLKELIKKAEEEHPHCRATVRTFYNNNVYYLIVNKTYTDVRLVGTPPVSMGKFGGETDNWMWPRHTCDFSMFRVYADENNEPAEYSENNKPYQPKQALKVSLRGVNEGDFTFIMGYPGSTQRFQTADQLDAMMQRNAIAVDARTARLGVMWEGMESDPKIRLQYANKYAGSANGWKKWQGEELAFQKLNIIGRERQKEADFMKWVNANSSRKEKYGKALEKITEAIAATTPDNNASTKISQSISTLGPVSVAASTSWVGRMRQGSQADPQEIAFRLVQSNFKDYNVDLEKKMAKTMLKWYREKADKENYPQCMGDFSTLDIDKYVEDLFANSIFASNENLMKACPDGKLDLSKYTSDPAILLMNEISAMGAKLRKPTMDYSKQLSEGSKEFAAGLLEWQAGKPSYPDANSTMRLTYGTSKAYSPKDGVLYRHFTTINGVIEKEDPSNYEFIVPEKLKELYAVKDFGQYADENGTLRTCFLTTNDITGGNSGSPVLDADGALIGLAFDGNWESMSSDVMFEPDLQRCIAVDIRFVLFAMDKIGGAGYLLNEMNILR